jgi:hypothetical protein
MSSNDAIGIAGIAVTVIGFGLTIWQLVRTANATVATKRAIKEANARMIVNHLLVLSPQIASLEIELDSAISVGDKVAAIKALVTYSHAATQIAALLESQPDNVDGSLILELRSSARAASVSKAALVSGVTKPLGLFLRSVALEISHTASSCAAISTRYQIKVA